MTAPPDFSSDARAVVASRLDSRLLADARKLIEPGFRAFCGNKRSGADLHGLQLTAFNQPVDLCTRDSIGFRETTDRQSLNRARGEMGGHFCRSNLCS